MKTIAMVVAVLAAAAGVAQAQERDGRRDGYRDGSRGDRQWDGRRDGERRWDGRRDGDGRHWDGNRDGRRWDGHRDGRRHWDGYRHGGYSHHHHSYPRYSSYPRYYGYSYAPRAYDWFWDPAPYYVAPPVYEVYQPPVIVERIYEEVPPPPQRRYEERSYAQVTPREPAPRPSAPTPATPAPRLERLTLSAKELFEFDQATLRMPQPRLDAIAEAMRNDPKIERVTITGYTDRLGTDSYNLKLSQRRAEAVKSYLVGKGVEARRLVAVGKGESNPVVQCNDKDRQALIDCLEPNRRVEVEEITVTRQVR